MTQQAGNALQKSLNRIDFEHKLMTWIMCGLLLMMFAQWIAMMFSPNDHKAMPWGLSAVMTSVWVGAFFILRMSSANTRAILKAVELLSRENQKD
jgi:hypothetical protein